MDKEKLNNLKLVVKEMIESYEKLPQHAMVEPVSNYDLSSVLLMFSTLLDCLND